MLDLDERRCVGGGLGCLGDDERDRLAGPQDLAPGERLVEAVGALGDDRQVGGGQDRHDARDRERLRRVDPLDPGVRRQRQDRPGVEQAAHVDVGCEPGPAGHLRPAIDPRDRAPDRGGQGIRAGIHGSHRTRRDLSILLGWVVPRTSDPEREEDETMSIRRLIRLAVVGWIVEHDHRRGRGDEGQADHRPRHGRERRRLRRERDLRAARLSRALRSTCARASSSCGTAAASWTCATQSSPPKAPSSDVRAVFGGGQILVPAGWRVVTSVRGLGGISDSRPPQGRAEDAPATDHRGHGRRRRLRRDVGDRR